VSETIWFIRESTTFGTLNATCIMRIVRRNMLTSNAWSPDLAIGYEPQRSCAAAHALFNSETTIDSSKAPPVPKSRSDGNRVLGK
jgi:hypothetical protein